MKLPRIGRKRWGRVAGQAAGWTAILAVGALPSPAQEEPWRTYEVYRPTIERHYVLNAFEHDLKYNHDTSVAWYGDRWYYLWNANQPPLEGKPGQVNYQSTSRDGRAWSAPEGAFSSATCCVNPVDYPRGVQWQPNLIVVEGELWASWCLMGPDVPQVGVYLSRLSEPGGKWRNEKLTFAGESWPRIEGQEFRVFPTQNPYRLRSGRVLLPVTLIGTTVDSQAQERNRLMGCERRDSVLYSDDLGRSWHVSPGAILPDKPWAQWEPTIWERADGTVMMLARDLDTREPSLGGPGAAGRLTWAESRDGGATWTPKQAVPIETASSRMHVLPCGGDRFVMVHCDWAFGRALTERYNVALFFNRGGGIDFTAGPGVTGFEKEVQYPQMWIRGDEMLVSYSQGRHVRSPKVARISPLPRPDVYYVYPRSKSDMESPVPRRVDNYYAFHGFQHIATRGPAQIGAGGFSIGAWLRPETECVVFDNRGAGSDGRPTGFVWGLGRNKSFIYLGTPEGNISSKLEMAWDTWSYAGITVDVARGEGLFVVNGQSEPFRFTPPGSLSGAAQPARIGMARSGGLWPYMGDIRLLVLYPSSVFTQAEHNHLHNRLAAEFGQSALTPERAPAGHPSVWMDPADDSAFERDFALPPGRPETFEVLTAEGARTLRFSGEGSAGVDLDENRRERGDTVRLRFRFRIEQGDSHVLCTIGDANQPARLAHDAGRLFLESGEARVLCGRVSPDGWTRVEIATRSDETSAKVNSGSMASVRHRPQATWVYLGQGYRTGHIEQTSSFLLDLASLASRVEAGGR